MRREVVQQAALAAVGQDLVVDVERTAPAAAPRPGSSPGSGRRGRRAARRCARSRAGSCSSRRRSGSSWSAAAATSVRWTSSFSQEMTWPVRRDAHGQLEVRLRGPGGRRGCRTARGAAAGRRPGRPGRPPDGRTSGVAMPLAAGPARPGRLPSRKRTSRAGHAARRATNSLAGLPVEDRGDSGPVPRTGQCPCLTAYPTKRIIGGRPSLHNAFSSPFR